MKSNYVNSDQKIKNKFLDVYSKINDSSWKLKSSIALKTNKLNSSIIYEISPSHGLNISADFNKYITGYTVDTWTASTTPAYKNEKAVNFRAQFDF